ncbi:bifunctional nuclease family protein [Natronorarus salvus]|uniref:bifunctional nuclease family protein n=1 Tax=Natronorarus salvus TaxID=3117733 RepID=UPI002F25F9E6
MDHEAEIRGVGISVDDEGGGAPAVVLEARGELLPIFVSYDQAQSIQLAVEEVPFERPLTHDLFVDMIAEFGGAIDRVRIDDLSGGTFYAKIDAEQYHGGERKKLVLDARPSDAIALAVRLGCPVVVSDEVLDEAAHSPEEFDELDFDEPA